MAFMSLRYEKAGRIATAAFSMPEKLNSITEARLGDVGAVLVDCETAELALN